MKLKLSPPKIATKAVAAVQKAATNAGHTIGNVAHSAGSAIKTGAQNVGSTIAAAAKSTATAAKAVAAKTVAAVNTAREKGNTAASIALFAPFTPLAIIYVKRRGLTPASTLTGLMKQVNTERKKSQFGVEGDADAFDVSDLAGYGLEDSGESADASVLLKPDIILAIVSFLKSIFEKIKAKKAAGQPLTPDEKAVADAAPEIEKAIQDAKGSAAGALSEADAEANRIAQEGKNEILNGGSGWKIGAVVLLILALVWYFILRKK